MEKAYDYLRRVHYYETDKMGITHHSNYVRWMEEARLAFLDFHGLGWATLEAHGMSSPVLSIHCEYKRYTTFGDEIRVSVFIKKYTGVTLKLGYVMTDTKTGETVMTSESEHCFLDEAREPVIVKKRFPAFDTALKRIAEQQNS